MNKLTIKNVTVKYGRFTAVDRANFEAESGRITGIIGANGGGKSSFIQATAGDLNFKGEIFFLQPHSPSHEQFKACFRSFVLESLALQFF